QPDEEPAEELEPGQPKPPRERRRPRERRADSGRAAEQDEPVVARSRAREHRRTREGRPDADENGLAASEGDPHGERNYQRLRRRSTLQTAYRWITSGSFRLARLPGMTVRAALVRLALVLA